MLRMVLGGVVGFVAWLVVWLAIEKIIAIFWPAFGAHQRAFEEAVKNGGAFTADTSALITHIILGSIVSVIGGYLAALIAGENARAPARAGSRQRRRPRPTACRAPRARPRRP